jgi:hypothetical protein
MKKQKVLATIPKTTVSLHLDFHGVHLFIAAFDMCKLEGKKVIYLAMDYDGAIGLYQYKPTPDLSFKDFDSGLDPDNSLLSGFFEEVTTLAIEAKLKLLDVCEWNKSVIKYTIEVPDE